MTRRLAGVVVLVSALCAAAEGTPYSVVIPAGFARLAPGTNPSIAGVLKEGGQVLQQLELNSLENSFRASIVIAATEKRNPDPNPAQACAAAATLTGLGVNAEVMESKLIKLAGGSSCQYSLNDLKRPRKGVTQTLVSGKRTAWMVTCSYDLRDAPAREACTALLASFSFLE